jgi:hypothetical protein
MPRFKPTVFKLLVALISLFAAPQPADFAAGASNPR